MNFCHRDLTASRVLHAITQSSYHHSWLIFVFIIVSNYRVSGKKCLIMKHECVQNETKRIKCVRDVTHTTIK